MKNVSSSWILILFFCVVSSYAIHRQHRRNQNGINVPQDLTFLGKPISNACMEQLVPIFPGDENEIDLILCAKREKKGEIKDPNLNNALYEWNYIGMLPHGDHLIYCYSWPEEAMGKFTALAVVRRAGNILKVVGYLSGGDRHASALHSGCELHANQLMYTQGMTLHSFFCTVMELFPELEVLAQGKSREKLWAGEAGYLGYGDFEVTITPDGKFGRSVLKSFYFADGDLQLYDRGKHVNEFIKDTPLRSMNMGDAIIEFMNYYLWKYKTDILIAEQLKEMMIEVFKYVKDERHDN